jgi:hypothetical protein
MAARRNFSVILLVGCLLSFTTKGEHYFRSTQPDKLTVAIQYFNEGKFEAALPVFAKLCYDLPYDYLIKFYYGACLVETGNFKLDAEKNLVLASSSEVPVKVYYYLGRLYHGRGDWNNAQRFYNRFKNNAEAPAISEMKVDDLIQLCYKEINPFISEKSDSLMISGMQENRIKKENQKTTLMQLPADSVNTPVISGLDKESEKVMTPGKDTVPHDSLENLQISQEVALNQEAGKENQVKTPAEAENLREKPEPVKYIDFQINDKVTYLVEDMFHVAEAKNEFRIAVNKETLLDSLLEVVQQLRKQYHLNFKPMVRDSLAGRIQNLEYQNLVLKTEIDQHYFQSRKLEQDWWNKTDYSSMEEYLSWRDSLIQIRNVQVIPEIKPVNLNPPDSAVLKAYIDTTAITPEEKTDSGLVYKIQIGANIKGISTQRKLQFQRLEKIRIIETLPLEQGVTIYTTGNLKNYEDALKLQAQIRLEGIKDAFVIAIRNGKKVTLPIENSFK